MLRCVKAMFLICIFKYLLRAEDKSITMASNRRSFEFTTAIRGFHIYQKVLQPELNNTLVCI